MLIEFKVTNFRSIREEQTFSLVANNADKDLPNCVIGSELAGLKGVRILKGAAIYGANASGKSNIVKAIEYVAWLVCRSATKLQPGDSTKAEPYKLDPFSMNKPCEFEITFVVKGVRYIFGLGVTSQRVMEEYLVAYPKGTPQRWYRRWFNEQTKEYEWSRPSTGFKHDKSLQEKTRENSLFLSVGPQFNHPQLTPIFNWFKNNLHILHLSGYDLVEPSFTAGLIEKQSHRDKMLNLLRSADIGVIDIKIREKEIKVDELKKKLPPAVLVEMESKGILRDGKLLEINLLHQGEGIQAVSLDFNKEESDGTRRFFELIGPWIEILEEGYTVFIDEIETSLHPLLLQELLKLLFCDKSNPRGAQVVFTTHNPFLLDNSLLRRDQIWFTEKTPAGTTRLYPFTDYHPRNDEARAKGYLTGRYGAIPYLPKGLKL